MYAAVSLARAFLSLLKLLNGSLQITLAISVAPPFAHKEMFRSKKQEIEDRVAKLTEEIEGLQPEKEPTSNEDYSVKLLELRERLKEYTGFDYSVIPESIVEAFIERIWVSKDEFRWYLRTGNKSEGEFDPDDHIKIGSFTLTIDDAKKYIYSFSTRRRVYKWVDLNVSVWI